MTESVLLIVHQETSDPGRVGRTLESLGYRLDICRHACGDALPETLDGHAGAVIFGGPMSANDDHLPFIRAELEWISMALDSGKPFLGICLGAQMLARVLGGTVGPHPDGFHEIGYFPITPTPAGEPWFGAERLYYQWHGEGFDLPAGCDLLATSEMYPNQAFAYNGNALAVQFHPEVTAAMMERWSGHAVHRLVMPGAQCREVQFRRRGLSEPHVDRWIPSFLSAWLAGGPEQEAGKTVAAD
jgi:GMP synthase (glutamine-hydrolysing)